MKRGKRETRERKVGGKALIAGGKGEEEGTRPEI